VLSLSEDEVASALERLEQKYMARKVFPMNSRVEKFCHNGKDALNLDAAGTAVLAELLMRGPQTPGDLRARASRMAPIETLEQLGSVLTTLIARGYVQRLEPLPGSRAERYVQLLSPGLHPLEPPAGAYVASSSHAPRPAASVAPDLVERVAALEAEVVRLKEQVRSLAEKLA